MMDASPLLLDIFRENAAASSLIPFFSSLTLETMRLFGGYALAVPALAALAGMVVGCALNWLVGSAIVRLAERKKPAGYVFLPKTQAFFRRYGFLIAAFHWMPFGALLVVATGFFRVPLWKTLLAVLAGGLLWLSPYFA